MIPMAAGKKASNLIIADAGINANREAHPVEAITPGLNEKLTVPNTPKNPAAILARPVTVIPRVIRLPVSLRSSRVIIDWIDPRSLIDNARKQKIKEIRTPGSKESLKVSRLKNPENRSV